MTNVQPNLALYRLNESGTRNYIENLLRKRHIDYISINGNLYSYRFPDQPLFVAHMDTVGENDVRKKISYRDGIVTRKGAYVLGADDKAGVDILLRNIDDINFVFTSGEESGCVGAYNLANDPGFSAILASVPFTVEYDRMGRTDMIAYCDVDLIDYVSSLTHYTDAQGLFTDVAVWEDQCPGVNLSCGYYGHHTSKERLVVSEWLLALDTLPILNQKVERFEVVQSYFNYNPAHYGSMYSSYEDNFPSYPSESAHVCSICGKQEVWGDEFYECNLGEILCLDCMETTYGIRRIS